MRSVWWNQRRAALAAALFAAVPAVAGAPGPVRAEAPADDGRLHGMAGLSAALQATQTRGVATLAIVTARDHPASTRLYAEFIRGKWARSQVGLVQIVDLARERDGAFVSTLGVTRFPTVYVYSRGRNGVNLAGTITDCATAEALAARLGRISLTDAAPSPLDPSLFRASHHGVYPSQQYAPPPAHVCPPPAPQPSPQPTSTLTLTPTAPLQTLTTTAGVIQVPGQNFVIQQGTPQIFVAPAQAPVVYVPQTLNAAPNNTLTLSAAPSQPAAPSATLSLAPSAPAAPTATLTSGPPTAINAAPAANAAIPVSLASGPPTSLAAVTNQTLSLPTAGSRTRVRVRGPGLLGSSLARFGERLTRLGRARIETVQETTLEAPLTQSPAAGLTTISTTSTTPVAPPPQTLTMTPPQEQPPCSHPSKCKHQPRCAVPPPAMPSLQTPPSHD
jgi:hypothetical protein